jgi:hypothetical protein
MNVSAAIIAGALVIAATIALTSRWAIVPTSTVVGALRLDRWTGQIAWCSPQVSQANKLLDCEKWQ